eukprot:6213661-Pleurochrysis_carterae.AAC.2
MANDELQTDASQTGSWKQTTFHQKPSLAQRAADLKEKQTTLWSEAEQEHLPNVVTSRRNEVEHQQRRGETKQVRKGRAAGGTLQEWQSKEIRTKVAWQGGQNRSGVARRPEQKRHGKEVRTEVAWQRGQNRSGMARRSEQKRHSKVVTTRPRRPSVVNDTDTAGRVGSLRPKLSYFPYEILERE